MDQSEGQSIAADAAQASEPTTNVTISSQTAEIIAPEAIEAAATSEATPETATEIKKIEEPQKSAEEVAREEKFAQKFAALSRKEKAIRDREKQLEARMKEIEAKQPQVEKANQEIETLKRRMKSEPLKVLEETGLSFQQLAEMVLNDGKPTPEMIISEREKAIQAKIDALEQKLSAKEKAEEESRLEAAINGFKSQINDVVANTEAYELIRVNDASDLVYDVIAAHHEETGEILDIKRAADAVESHLLEEAKKHLELPKIKSMLQPPKQQQPVATAAAKPASKTLTNASATQAKPQVSRKLSNEESMTEAAKLIKWLAE